MAKLDNPSRLEEIVGKNLSEDDQLAIIEQLMTELGLSPFDVLLDYISLIAQLPKNQAILDKVRRNYPDTHR